MCHQESNTANNVYAGNELSEIDMPMKLTIESFPSNKSHLTQSARYRNNPEVKITTMLEEVHDAYLHTFCTFDQHLNYRERQWSACIDLVNPARESYHVIPCDFQLFQVVLLGPRLYTHHPLFASRSSTLNAFFSRVPRRKLAESFSRVLLSPSHVPNPALSLPK